MSQSITTLFTTILRSIISLSHIILRNPTLLNITLPLSQMATPIIVHTDMITELSMRTTKL